MNTNTLTQAPSSSTWIPRCSGIQSRDPQEELNRVNFGPAGDRRTFLAHAAKAAAVAGGAYALSKVPIGYAQNADVIDIPTLQTPVTLDGRWDPEGEWADARQISDQFGFLFLKYDQDWTDVYVDFIADKVQGIVKPMGFVFDTQNKNTDAPGTKGAYSLELLISKEISPTPAVSIGRGSDSPGILFNHEDYNFRYSFGPSPNYAGNHSNLEVQFSTRKLTESIDISNPDATIGLSCVLFTGTGPDNYQLYHYPHDPQVFEKIRFSGIPLPEMSGISAAAALAGGGIAIPALKRLKMSRRRFIGLRE